MTAASGSRGRTGVLVALVLILLAFLIASLPSGGDEARRSSFSRGREGRLFAYLLLDELGFEPRAWRDSPGDLPRGRALLWLPDTPEEPPEYLRDLWAAADEGVDEDALRRSTGRKRDPLHYRRFMEEGGVMMASVADERLEFLTEVLGVEAVNDLRFVEPEREPGDLTQEIAAFGREPMRIERDLWRVDRRLTWIEDPRGIATPLVADPTEPRRAAAWSIPVGRGELVVLHDDVLFENRAITEADNALYLVRLIESIGSFDEVLFDEYALGSRQGETPLDLAVARGNLGVTLHVLAAVGILVWGWVAAGAFPRDPQGFGTAAPRARVDALGTSLVSSGRFALLGSMLRRGVIERLPGGRGATATGEDVDATAVLRGVAHAARSPEEFARWEQALRPRRIEGEDDLEEYARTLAPLERLASREEGRQNRGAGDHA